MELHRADPAYRRRSLLALAITLMVTAAALFALQDWLADVVQAMPRMAPDARRTWLRALLTGLFLGLSMPFALAARSFHRFARNVQVERRLPPHRWHTWRDVRILRGAAALDWARRTHRIATACATVAGVLAAFAALSWMHYS